MSAPKAGRKAGRSEAPSSLNMVQNIIFSTGEYYHIYNRGVDKREVFLDEQDYWKFFDCLRDLNNETYYEQRLSALGISKHSVRPVTSSDFKKLGNFLQTQEKLVDVVTYTLNPNHFHLILKQLKDKGISNFMHRNGTSFTNYFNKKYGRSGVLFQGPFKKIHIDNENYLLWLLAYVNGNIEIHGLGKAADYPWSSYQAIKKEMEGAKLLPDTDTDRTDRKEPRSFQSRSNLSVLSGLDIVLSQFNSEDEFKNFVAQVIRESRTKKDVKKYLLEKI